MLLPRSFLLKKLIWLILATCCLSPRLKADVLTVEVDFTIPVIHQLGPDAVIIPFTPLGGLIMLKAKVNGEEGNFILDTGANGLVLNDRYFQPDRLLRDVEGVGLSGQTSRLGVKRTDAFDLDELQFPNARAETIDLSQLETRKRRRILGLIGYDLLKEFEIMFDYRQRFLTFSRVDKNGDQLIALPHTVFKIDSVDFELGHHIPVIEVKVGGRKKRMAIDTGAEYNLLHVKRSRKLMKHFKILSTLDITGTGQRSVEALAGKLYRVVLKERYKCGGMSTVITNLKELESIYHTKLDGILGYEFLAPWLFSINYRKERVFLHKLTYVSP